MYKAGDKFIVEIGGEYVENPFESVENAKTPTMLYKIKGFNSLVFDEKGLDRLEKAENLERLAYGRGYSKAENDYFKQTEKDAENTMQAGYEKGLSDVWEFWKKLQNIEIREDGASVAKNIFDCRDMVEVLIKYSPQEAIEKLKAWEEKQEIKVGDVVKADGIESCFVVTHIFKEHYDCLNLSDLSGCTIHERKSIVKTGKHIDLTEIFKGLEGEGAD